MILFIAIAALVLGCAGAQRVDRGAYEVVALDQLAADGEAFAERIQGGGDPLMIKIEAGQEAVLDLDVRLPFAAVEAGDNKLRFERDVYLLFSEGGLLLSPDGELFAPIHDFEALKEVFGFDGGQLSVGLGISEAEGARVKVLLAAE